MIGIPFDIFTGAFISKISEYDFLELPEEDRELIVDGFLVRAVTAFRKNCKYDLLSNMIPIARFFDVEIADEDLGELVEILSEGMVVQWLKPYVYKQENLENVLNTRDFTTYSSANLLTSVREVYEKAQHDYTQMIREYSYNHGDLGSLHI